MTNLALLVALPVDPDTLAMIACLALAAATLIFIFFIEPDASDSAPHRSRLDQLLEQRDMIYDNLRDLKFDIAPANLPRPDYEQMKNALETDAAVVLAEIENFTGNQARLPRRDADTIPSGARAGTR